MTEGVPEDPLNPIDKGYLDLPGEDKNKKIVAKDRKVSLKESTKVFEHYMSPGEKPDLQDLLTNPKFGNQKRTNVIYEHSTGKPQDSITEKPVVNHVTEEWVDDRKHESRFKPQDVDYNLVLSSKDLQKLPPMFNKDFTTPDADIHLTIDKTALATKTKSVTVETDTQPEQERRLYIDSAPGLSQAWGSAEDDEEWKKAFNSFGNSKGNILDAEIPGLETEDEELAKLAPSSISQSMYNFSGNPKENLTDMMGGVSENDLLNKFVRNESNGFQDNMEDLNALKKFEKQMGDSVKGARRVPILI